MATKKNEDAAAKPKTTASAKTSGDKKPVKAKKVNKPAQTKGEIKKRRIKLPKFLRAIGEYFKGAWHELRQVRWPNRRATWGLTLAVMLFTLFWVGVIIGLDAVYDYVFNEIIL